ncbi:hypothetical protein OAV48_00945 [bacterium]|nr:hypothetical protein [bacterium]
MYNQMEQFEDGGLKDEGGTVDEVSGNEVPIGGTKKGVRDNISAMVSEGEFIFPEDVTRYIGLDKLMQLRQDAKMGLKKMEAMGQMGNGDEATMEDDMPFEMADLIIVGGPMEEPQEKYKGGVLHAQQGTLVGPQPATGIAGYQPSVYANRAPINPYQYQAPASAFTPPTYQNTQVAPSQPTSGYMPKFVGQGVTRKTVTGRETPRVTAEEFVEDIYLEVKYINRETGDIRTFKFYQGEPISEIPAGYVPYEEGQDPAEGTTPPEGDVAPTTAQVSRGSDDDDRAPPPPPPFNWDEATPEAIVNEVNKIKGSAGSIMTGLAFALNPVFGSVVYAATKANEKQTLTKLGELLKDKTFVKKMSDAGQLKKLKDSLSGLEEKTKKKEGEIDIDLLGLLGSAIKGVSKALGLSSDDEKKLGDGAVSAEAGIAPPKKPEQKGEEPTITIVDDPFATSAAAPFDYGTGVLGKTSVLESSYDEVPTPTQLETLKQATAEEAMGLSSFGGKGKLTSSQIANAIASTKFTSASSIIDNIIAESRKETAPVVKDDKDDDGPTFPTYTPPSVKDDDEPIIPVVTPSDDKDDDDGTLTMLGLTPAQEEQAEAESQVSLDVFGGEGTPQVTIPTPAPAYAQPSQDPYAEAGRPTSRSSDRDDGPSAAQIAQKAAETAATQTADAIDRTYNLSPTQRTGGAALDKAYGISGLAKGGLASKPKPKKKATSKKRGLAARK